MRIDSHQHFWYYHPERDSWIDDRMANIRKDFLPGDLGPILKKNNMDACVAVQANESEEETQFLLDLAAGHPFIKGVVGWVDLSAADSLERLRYFAQNPYFKGVRHVLQDKPAEFMLRDEFQQGISHLGKLDLTYDLLVLEHQLPAAIALVRKFPDQRFVLDHLAKPNISQGVSTEWEKNIRELAALGNVYGKLSGLLTETEGFRWRKDDFVPFLEVAVQAFGKNRLLFGSDWPVCLAAGEYEDTVTIITNFCSQQNEIDLEKVLGENATKCYRL